MRILIVFIFLFCNGCQSNHFSDAMLEEFYAMDKNLIENNKIIEQTVSDLLIEMEDFSNIRTQYIPLFEQVSRANGIAQNFQNYIDKLKERLVAESGGIYTKEDAQQQGKPEWEGRPIGGKDTHTPQRIFVSSDNGNSKEAEGLILQKKILELRNAYLALVENMWTDHPIKGTIFFDLDYKTPVIEELEAETPLSNLEKIAANKTWISSTFDKMPVAAVVTMLRKIQNDAEIARRAIIDFFDCQTGRFRFGSQSPVYEFFVFSSSRKTHIRLGEIFETNISLGAYYLGKMASFSVGNETLESINGKAFFRTKPTTTGKKKYTLKTTVTDQFSGDSFDMKDDFYYEVLE